MKVGDYIVVPAPGGRWQVAQVTRTGARRIGLSYLTETRAEALATEITLRHGKATL